MTKAELIQRLVHANSDLNQPETERVFAIIFDEISEALAQGRRAELRGFGVFTVKDREPREGRNPRTGDTVKVDAKRVPFFKTGKQLHQRLNAGRDDDASVGEDAE